MTRATVHDIMTTDVATVGPGSTFKDIAGLLTERRVSGVPVVAAGGKVIGVISEADLLPKEEFKSVTGDERPHLTRRAAKQARVRADADTAAELMSSPAVTITAAASVAEAARTLAEHGIKRLPVVDGDRLVGIVSRADVLKVFLKSDADIGHRVMEEVVKRCLWEDPEYVTVNVQDGIVTLGGRLQLKSLIPIAVRLTAAIDGVVDVIDDLNYERDDTTREYQRYWR
jgi:CBS domain-containing protein